MAEDWDLYAVVRSYRSATAASANSTTTDTTNPIVAPAAENTNQEYLGGESSSFANLPHPCQKAADNPSDFPGFISHKEESFQRIEEIYNKQQHENAEPYSINTSTPLRHQYSPVLDEFQKQQQYTLQPEQSSLYPQHSQRMIQRHQQQHLHLTLGSSTISSPCTSPQPIRSRRRKNQQAKMINRMIQEELSADSWAWRKYGQKPIKGSPYPRHYYRCSTAKGCVARRQVERCPTEPHMYVVSYSGGHSHPRPTHRSSLAGSTRTKASTKPSTSSEPVINPAPTATSMATVSSPASPSSFSPRRDNAGAAEEGVDAEVMLGEEEEEGEGWDNVEDDEDNDGGDGEF